MSKKNNGLSEENLGQVAGGAILYNADGSITLNGEDSEIAKKAIFEHRARKAAEEYMNVNYTQEEMM